MMPNYSMGRVAFGVKKPSAPAPTIVGYIASGAGSTQVNGTYCEYGVKNSKPYYRYYTGGAWNWYLYYITNYWVIASNLDVTWFGSSMYYKSSTASTPPLTGWTGMGAGGMDPGPTLTTTTC